MFETREAAREALTEAFEPRFVEAALRVLSSAIGLEAAGP